MNILSLARPVFNLVSSMSVGTVIGNVIKSTTPANLGKVKTLGVTVGGFILSATLSEMITDRADKAFFEPVEKTASVVNNTFQILEGSKESPLITEMLKEVEDRAHREIILDELVNLGHLDEDTAAELKETWGNG